MTLVFVPMVSSAQSNSYVHDNRFPFVIITKDTVEQLPAISDEEFYETSSGVFFKVNRTEIPADDKFMTLYRDSVLPWVNLSHLQLRKVFIRGAASPEGPYANNQRLGCGRSEALLKELRSDLLNQYIETDADISCVTEDYAYLCMLMKKAGDKDYQIVQRIYDECGGDELCCKRKLMAQRTLWNRLLREYFPQLRSARLILWFSEPDMEHASLVSTSKGMTMVSAFASEDEDTVKMKEKIELGEIVFPERTRRRHLIALRTNLIHDAFYMPQVGWVPSPNLQLEYYPLDGHLTYNAGATWGTHRHWDVHDFFQIRDFQLEVRRYFKGGGQFLGAYLGVFGEYNVYGIGLNEDDGWEGEGAGAGLTLGYVMPLTKKKNLRLEFMLAGGFYRSLYDPYVYGNPVTGDKNGLYYYDYLGSAYDFRKRNHRLSWLGPTNVGIQLTYDIIYRPRKKCSWQKK